MSDIRTLLLTDVVDSTRLTEALGDAATAALWAAHDRAARDLLQPWRGLEIDKSDGMLLLFDSVADALGFAQEYQQALAALPVPLRARAGVHAGPVILRENNPADVARGAKPLEVDGIAKPTAARVMSVAAGGQVLLSAEARAALGRSERPLHSHGHWVLKGLAEPLELFELGRPGQPPRAPEGSDKAYRVVERAGRWLPVAQIPNNLPQQLTSFIGREREIDDIKELLERTHLLMLLGMGGLGKTRLSLQVAAEVMHRYPDGVWFIDLAPIRDPALVVDAAARVIGLSEEPGLPLLQTLCAHLRSRRVLFIVDNCEHLIESAAQVTNAVLRAAPEVRVLASSRQALRVPGEQTYAILPLPIPAADDGVDALERSTAVRLFVDRARAHKPGFSINEREAGALAELVARLEGIPLALELAAARVRSLGLADINARLKDRYKLLTGGGRVLLERQQTLRALVDWSHELLSEAERLLLARLAVFAGGWDLQAAEQVCAADPLQADDMLDLLGSLVEKSLVQLDEREGALRYRMLETIRDYAREKLGQRSEAAAVSARHAEHFFGFAKAARDGLVGPEQAMWVERVEADLDNLRAATALALAGGVDTFIAVKLAVALQGFWTLRGYTTEGRKVVQAALALPAVQASDMAQAHALYVGACLAREQGDAAEASRMLETCLALRRGLGDASALAATLSTLALARLQAGDAASARHGEHEALQIFRQLGHRRGEAIVLSQLGLIGMHLGDADEARASVEQALTIARDIGHRETEAECELVLGTVDGESGAWADAVVRFERSLAICREAGDRRGAANAVRWIGRAALQAGDLDLAQDHLCEALRSFRRFEMRAEMMACLEDLAALACARGRWEAGAQISAAAALARERLAMARSPRDEQRWQAHLAALRAASDPRGFDAAWVQGRRWDLSDAVGLSARLLAPDAA